jgi:hypothetical protein
LAPNQVGLVWFKGGPKPFLIVLLRSRIRLDGLPEKRVTLREGMLAQILAVQLQASKAKNTIRCGAV